jgi:lysophospholipase L1-like esterase
MPEYSPGRGVGANPMLFCFLVSRLRVAVPVALAALGAACGGGSSPSGPDTGPTPVPGVPVSGFVYYDENANGVMDAGETVRFPGVTVSVGERTGQSATGGHFTVANVPVGPQIAQARPDTLPAYFTPGPQVTVNVPPSGDVAVPAVLSLGDRKQPNVYLAFGDSITWGEGSGDGSGYRDILREDLRAYWGKADVINDGIPGTKSVVGQARIPGDLAVNRPAYVLILYGTNDWNEPDCRNDFPCYTVDALLSMVQDARSAGVEPVLGTIPPVNPDYTDRGAEDRNDWVTRMNVLVRDMASREKVSVAEIHGDFLKQPDLASLFADFQHPNDAGYRVMSQSFFAAITRPSAASASSGRGFSFFFRAPGTGD